MSVYGGTSHKDPQRGLLLSALIKSTPFPFSVLNWKLSSGPANDCNKKLNALSCWHILWSGSCTYECCWVSVNCPFLNHYISLMLLNSTFSLWPDIPQKRWICLGAWWCHRWHTTGVRWEVFGSSHTGQVPVLSHVDRKTSRARSVERFSQVKHGNISFLLIQESGTHLCEVALSF